MGSLRSRLIAQLKSLIDIRVLLIVLFIAVSTGHVGRLFADREAGGQEFVGYLLAVAIDGMLAISLYEIARAKETTHKRLAVIGFIIGCLISGGFNIYYYRQFYPADHVLLSSLLGLAAPMLAAFLALLKSKGDVQRTEAENQLEIEKFRILQEEETKRATTLEAEKTKQAKERTKQRQFKSQAESIARQEAEIARRNEEKQQQLIANLGKSLDILRYIVANPGHTREEIGQAVGIAPRTVGYHLAKLEKEGAIVRNGQGIEVVWDTAIIMSD